MKIITALRERVERLATVAVLDVPASQLPTHAAALPDAIVLDVMRDLAAIANDVTRMQAVLAGVTARRSRREDGQNGLAATQGHATPVSLVQSITGGTRADAQRHVRVGTALFEAEPSAGADAEACRPAWHEPLARALMAGEITAAQHDAIRGGLGRPIVAGVDEELSAHAWAVAAQTLIDECAGLTVEELAAHARALRDALDPTGAEERFARRFEQRSLRMWIDRHGQEHAHLVLDDEMGPWLRSLFAAALRPRRGGPRFMTDEERAAADDLIDDPRTNDQLQYDLFADVLRAGALARAEDVFGARQAGVRFVVVKDAAGPRDAFGRLSAVGNTEDGTSSVPGSVVDRTVCAVGSIEVTVDGHGNPLDVGREQRLFTTRQRVALAVRDGGCVWPGCTTPASYCEAHHCDHWREDDGKTDIDRGVLLCRFHHLLLHNQGWRILRFARVPSSCDHRAVVKMVAKTSCSGRKPPGSGHGIRRHLRNGRHGGRRPTFPMPRRAASGVVAERILEVGARAVGM